MALGLAFWGFAATAEAGTLADVSGLWLTEAKNAHIRIADCGNGTPCGTIAWIDFAPGDVDKDLENPNPALRERPLTGLQLLRGFTADAAGWKGGRIYDPESGRTYGSKIRLDRSGVLKVDGCLGPVCQTQRWTRLP
jgi:uncharacterized protein (DUF2147 family)